MAAGDGRRLRLRSEGSPGADTMTESETVLFSEAATAYCGGRKIPLPLTDAIAAPRQTGREPSASIQDTSLHDQRDRRGWPVNCPYPDRSMYDRKTAMNQPTHTTTGRAADAALEQGPGLIYRSRFTRRRPARAYPSTVDADERLRNRRLGAGPCGRTANNRAGREEARWVALRRRRRGSVCKRLRHRSRLCRILIVQQHTIDRVCLWRCCA